MSNYTDPVREALRALGHAPDQPEPVPVGQVRYHIAVDQTLLSGIAPASTVAAALRGLADQLEQGDKPDG